MDVKEDAKLKINVGSLYYSFYAESTLLVFVEVVSVF